ncbi:DUF421 domain-containing protein [Clostridium sp. MSJ-11]|uniref:DUF421 domain-containing protein n=1 Tax=Clostridium mobile TaxID=2841512 RepID=A0ABS6ELB2_9CLOT|nr:DUF421 domain-containing protein [Clostridium mobile]MBU5485907.1 DUF421 domain-containing protein [Clostridium mobile]
MSEGLVVVVRSIIGYFSLFIFTRALGKQQISQLTFFDYVLGITIGSIAASLTTDLSSRAWPHWVGLFTWAILSFLLQSMTIKWMYIAKYVDGEPTIVIMNGEIMEDALRKMKYRIEDVLQLLRNKDIFDLSEVEFAILEPNGNISVLKKAEHNPLTPKDMNISVQPSNISTELIYDGMIIEENLAKIKKDKNWLIKELKKQKVKDISQVFLATLESTGNLYIDKYEDNGKNKDNTKK